MYGLWSLVVTQRCEGSGLETRSKSLSTETFHVELSMTKAQPSFKTAVRQQESLLSPLEKRVLLWLAHRMPAWVNSDHLTLLGFAGMILSGCCYFLARYSPLFLIGAVISLGINWFGDSLDGTLARVRQRQRPRYGFYVDHIIDAFGMVFLVGGLGLSGYMSGTVAMMFLIVYFLMSIEIYLATYTVGVFRLSYGILGPTEFRIVVGAGSVVLLYKPVVTIAGESYLLCDVSGVVAIIVISLIAITSSIRNTARLYDEERLP
jgi:archaetidylinositol phosphate synthase